MFPKMKMEEYMGSELCDIFPTKTYGQYSAQVTENPFSCI